MYDDIYIYMGLQCIKLIIICWRAFRGTGVAYTACIYDRKNKSTENSTVFLYFIANVSCSCQTNTEIVITT